MVDEAKYKKWFMLDTLLIFGMWLFLVISESYIAVTMLSEVVSRDPELIPTYLLALYGVFLLFMYIVEGLGCLNVWKSIKQHMYEMEYYE